MFIDETWHSLETQIEAERWTRLDQALAGGAAAHGGVIDLRPEPGQQHEELRAIKIGRMRKLEALGLAHRLGPAQWSLAENAEEELRELGERIHRARQAAREDHAREYADKARHNETSRDLRPLLDRSSG